MNKKNTGEKNILQLLRQNGDLVSVVSFCLLSFILIMVGVFAMRVAAVPMCVLVMIEAGIAVMLHRAEIWVHGLLVIAELVAGILVGRLGPVILCAAVYIAATAALQVLGKNE